MTLSAQHRQQRKDIQRRRRINAKTTRFNRLRGAIPKKHPKKVGDEYAKLNFKEREYEFPRIPSR